MAVGADESQLGGGGAGVNAEEAVARVVRQIFFGDDGGFVAGAESVIFRPTPEQRLQTGHLKGHGDAPGKPGNQVGNVHRFGAPGFQRRAHGGKEMGIFRVHDVFRRQLQSAYKGLFQLRHKMQRSA